VTCAGVMHVKFTLLSAFVFCGPTAQIGHGPPRFWAF